MKGQTVSTVPVHQYKRTIKEMNCTVEHKCKWNLKNQRLWLFLTGGAGRLTAGL